MRATTNGQQMTSNRSLLGLRIFDSHFHIIDQRFPLVPNRGFVPDSFNCNDYMSRTRNLNVVGGAVVSGSFQAFDQGYLLATLGTLGPRFVGVTQLPESVSDDQLRSLNDAGVRALRFNLKRGGSEGIEKLEPLAKRVHEIAGWHVELYVDSEFLSGLYATLVNLPAVTIDHLGLSKVGFPVLLKLVEKGVHVKATGFGRVDFNVKEALREIVSANPSSLVFGTDLPSTRAPRPFSDTDILLVREAVGDSLATRIFFDNAITLYRPKEFVADAQP